MALSTENNRQSFTAVENQTKFTFTIPYFDTTDISVQQEASDGTITTLSYNANPSSATQFKVDATNNNPADGGTVTLGAAATTGDTYVVIRDVPYTQQYDLQEGSTIDPTALNKALDRVVAQNQQQNDALDRSIVFPATDPDTITYDVDSTTNRANKALGFDALGNITELDLAASGTVSGNTNAGIDVTNNQISARIDTDSLEFNSGKINVKDSGIGTSEIADDAVTNAKINASAVNTTEIADDAVTYAKIQDISTSNSVLGNTSTGTVAERSLVGDILLDEDDMATDSNAKGATQQSIKAYVGSKGITQTSGTAPYYGIRAWVRFQGTGTPQILDSGNISGFTRNGQGDYTFTLTTAMSDANYVVNVSCSTEATVTYHAVPFIESISAGSFRVSFFNVANAAEHADKSIVCITVVG